MRHAYGKRPECGAVVHPGSLIADDIRNSGLTEAEVLKRCGLTEERLRALTECRAYPNERESWRIGPVFGRGKHNLYRHAQAHRQAGG